MLQTSPASFIVLSFTAARNGSLHLRSRDLTWPEVGQSLYLKVCILTYICPLLEDKITYSIEMRAQAPLRSCYTTTVSMPGSLYFPGEAGD